MNEDEEVSLVDILRESGEKHEENDSTISSDVQSSSEADLASVSSSRTGETGDEGGFYLMEHVLVCEIEMDEQKKYPLPLFDTDASLAETFSTDIPYRTHVSHKFPMESSGRDVVPDHVWMFCFPEGARLLKSMPKSPSVYHFVLTELEGGKTYGTALIFYRPFLPSYGAFSTTDNSEVQETGQEEEGGISKMEEMLNANMSDTEMMDLLDSLSEISSNQKYELTSSSSSYEVSPRNFCCAPVAYVILSRHKYLTLFRKSMTEIYRLLSHQEKPLAPVEVYLGNMVLDVPSPISDTINIGFTIGTAKFLCHQPHSNYEMPLLDFSLKDTLFSVLDCNSVVRVFSLLLRECKIIIVGTQISMLSLCAEALVSLLYPFEYPYIYIPVLPRLLVDFLNAPMPFVVGILKDCFEENVEGRIKGGELDAVVVDIDVGSVDISAIGTENEDLPKNVAEDLIYRLRNILKPHIFVSDLLETPNTMVLDDQATQSNSYSTLEFSFGRKNLGIRSAFLDTFSKLLDRYREFIQFIRVFPEPITLFRKTAFLELHADEYKDFLRSFMETQMFAHFLEVNSIPKDNIFERSKSSWRTSEKGSHTNKSHSLVKNRILHLPLFAVPKVTMNKNKPKPAVSQENLDMNEQLFPEQQLNRAEFEKLVAQSESKEQEELYRNELIENAISVEGRSIYGQSKLKFVKRIVAKVLAASDQSPLDVAEESRLERVLREEYGPEIFAKELLSRGDELSNGVVCVNVHVFELLSKWVSHTLEITAKTRDYAATRLLQQLSTRISTKIYPEPLKIEQEVFISNRVKGNSALLDPDFWESSLYNLVATERQELFKQHGIDEFNINWKEVSKEKREKLAMEEDGIHFSIIGQLVYQMLNFGATFAQIKRFVVSTSTASDLSGEHVSTLMTLLDNMSRANEMVKEEETYQEEKITSSVIGRSRSKQEGKKVTVVREHWKELVKEKKSLLAAKHRARSISSERPSNGDDGTSVSGVQERRVQGAKQTEIEIKKYHSHRKGVLCLDWGLDIFVSGSFDNTIRVYKDPDAQTTSFGFNDPTQIVASEISFSGHNGPINSVKILNETRIASGSTDRCVKLWDIIKEKKVKTFRGHKDSVSCLSTVESQPGAILSGSNDTYVKLFDPRSGKRTMRTFSGHTGPITSISSHEFLIFTASHDNTSKIWDIRNGQTIYTLKGHTDWVKKLDHRGGKIVATASFDGCVKIWDVESGRCLRTLSGHTGIINCVTFFSDKRLISGGEDGTIRLWDHENGRLVRTMTGHTSEITTLAIPPLLKDVHGIPLRHNIFVSGSVDSTLRVWDFEKGECLHTLDDIHKKPVTCVLASLKGRGQDMRILSGSSDATVQLIDIKAVVT